MINKKGFTLVEMLTIIVLIGLVMMIVFPAVSKLLKRNNEEMYQTYEDMMVEYAKVSSLNVNNVIVLSDLENLEQVKNQCTGYVTINHSSTPNVYKAYIKCDDKYKTENFNANLAG